MRYHILQRIDAEDNLALLLNAYMKPLFMLEQVALPCESMHDFRHLLDSAAGDAPTEEAQQRVHWAPPRLYHLCVLNNSLTDLHKNIHWAIKALTYFFTEYEGDLQRYAIDQRLSSLEEFGGGDATDWQETGEFNEDGEPEWKVTFKDDEASLRPYSFHQHLQQYFAAADTLGERIGSSQPQDFAYFSDVVARATAFSPAKMLRSFTGQDLPLHHPNEAGEMVPESLGDEVERELNEDLHNESIVSYFRQVLTACHEANALFATARETSHFQQLLTKLEGIRDVLPPF